MTAFGVYKRPVAAGRGSGGHAFDIEPGHPERSILVHRMATDDPGIAMPELGRRIAHAEAIELVSRWIAEMDIPRAGVGDVEERSTQTAGCHPMS